MAATTNMNIILGQGNAVNEVHNIKKQNLELNQQVVAQETDGKKKEDKTKVQKFDASDKVAIREDDREKGDKDHKKKRKRAIKGESKGKSLTSGGNRIDIRV
jgi:hypothetical protein